MLNFNAKYVDNLSKVLKEVQSQNYYHQKKEYPVFDTKVNALSLLTDVGIGLWIQGFLSSLLPFMQSRSGSFLDKVVQIIRIAKQNFQLNYLAFKKALQTFLLSHNFIFFEFFKVDAEYFDYELLLNIILRYSPFMFKDIKKRDEIARLKRYGHIYLILQNQYLQKTNNLQKELNLNEFIDLLLTVTDLCKKFYPVTGYVMFVKYIFLWEKYKNKKISNEFESKIYFDDKIKSKKTEISDDEKEENIFISIDHFYKEPYDNDDEEFFIKEKEQEIYYYEEEKEEKQNKLHLIEVVKKVMNEILSEEEKKVIYFHFYKYDIYNQKNNKKIQKNLGYSVDYAQRVFERALFKLRSYFENFNLYNYKI